MPASKKTPKTLAKKARATRAVAGRLAGQATTQIAERLAVSRKTISRDLGSPHARYLVESLVQKHEGELRRLYALSLKVIGEGLEANVIDTLWDREEDSRINLLTDIPDHKTRLEAVHRYRELLSLGLSLPAINSGDEEGTFTWEQVQTFEQVLEKRLQKA